MDDKLDFEVCLKDLIEHKDSKTELVSEVFKVTSNGSQLLCGLSNGDVCLWSMDKDIAVLESEQDQKEVTCVVWAGDRGVSAHIDGLCVLWDLRGQKELGALRTSEDVPSSGQSDPQEPPSGSQGEERGSQEDPPEPHSDPPESPVESQESPDHSPSQRSQDSSDFQVDRKRRFNLMSVLKSKKDQLRRQDSGPAEGNYVSVMAATSDGRVVAGSTAGELMMWDLEQRKLIFKISAHSGEVLCMHLQGDQRCVTGSRDSVVSLWDLKSLRCLAAFECECPLVTCVELAGTRVLAADGKVMRVWDAGTSSEVGCYAGHNTSIQTFKTLDKTRCVSCDLGSVQEWSMSDFTATRSFRIEGWSFEWQKSELIIGAEAGLSVLDLKSFQTTTAVSTEKRLSFVHYYKGKCACVSGSSVETVTVNQYQQECELSAHEYAVAGVLPSGSDRLVSWSEDTVLRVLSVDRQCEVATLSGHSSNVNCVAIASDGICVSGSDDTYLKAWDLSKMEEVPTDMKHSDPVSCVAVTPKGKIVSGDVEGGLRVWSAVDYSPIGVLTGHTKCVFCVAVSSDEVAVTGSWDCTVRVWDLVSCSLRATLKDHSEKIWSIALASGGRCVSASADKTLRVWDLGTGSLKAKLSGHANEVLTVAASGEKCVSGSTDKSIILWSLTNYLQEARFLCTAEVLKIVFVSESQFVSGHRRGEVKVWQDCREVATFRGHTQRVWGLSCLGDSHLVTASHDGTVRLWGLGQLSHSLARCADYQTLELEIRKKQPVETQLRQQIPDLKSGNYVPLRKDFRPYFFNSLHFCAYYNHAELMKNYLSEGDSLLRGVFGSPLTIALERKTIECVDAVLDHLASIAGDSAAWKSFEVVNDDLLPLLGSGSSRLEAFFASVLQPPPQSLPAFIAPVTALPLVKFAAHHSLCEYEFCKSDSQGTELVHFCVSLLQVDLASGSIESVALLRAAVDCEDKRVLLTDYFRTVIEEKWDRYFPFTLGIAAVYVAMLCCLLGVINWESRELCISYLALNGVLALYELAQIVALRLDYIADGWNFVDFVRCSLSFVWGALVLKGYIIERYFTMMVVVLDFVRGFTHFRAFHRTRVFVYLTFSVVAEVYSFLVILAYSVLAFGIFTSVLIGEKSLAETWKKAYNITMGNFNTEHYETLEWVVFTGATVTNIVVMMNLLISILGEAYEKAQMTVLESDLHMQASLVLEYETLMVWRRRSGQRTWVVTCREADKSTEQLEWTGKVLQITNSLRGDLTRAQGEITANIGELSARVRRIEDFEKEMAGRGETQVTDMRNLKAEVNSLKEAQVENMRNMKEGFGDINEFQSLLHDDMTQIRGQSLANLNEVVLQRQDFAELGTDFYQMFKVAKEMSDEVRERSQGVGAKVAAIEERVAGIEGKVDGIEAKIDAVFGLLKSRS